MKTLLTGAALLLLAAPAAAFDGQFVRDMCLSDDAEQVSLCAGYTTGLAQSLMLTNRADNPLGNFCQDALRPQEAGALMLEYLDANPDEHSQDASAVMLMALIDRFPCD